ncbi:MAG TPA: LON peptidase substrate-binding domain-containing protein [Thermodesulfobacteriota bacterium]|nr:LON peptidase substrate-binding domain-containing protein [Thermodesulfobacteriota bacterium]
MKGSNFDLEDILDLTNFSGIVPLFPLATVVFFPNTLLPLHVFEPRYRQMVNDVLCGERIIGMILLKPGWEKGYYGNPEVYSVACMGRVISVEPLEEGKFNIVLFGLKRVKVLEIIKDFPYRAVRVGILEDIHGNSEYIYRERIKQIISTWNDMLGKEQESHRINIAPELPIERLTDTLASSIISNVFEKQHLLEEPDIEKRAVRILDYLETKFKAISLVNKAGNRIVDKRNFN